MPKIKSKMAEGNENGFINSAVEGKLQRAKKMYDSTRIYSYSINSYEKVNRKRKKSEEEKWLLKSYYFFFFFGNEQYSEAKKSRYRDV